MDSYTHTRQHISACDHENTHTNTSNDGWGSLKQAHGWDQQLHDFKYPLFPHNTLADCAERNGTYERISVN